MANVLTNPTSFAYSGPQLRAALCAGGSYDYTGTLGTASWRLSPVSADVALLPAAGSFPQARVDLLLEGDADNSPVAWSSLPQLIPADSRIAIYAEIPIGQPNEGDREFIFEGYPTIGTLSFTGQHGVADAAYSITCTSMLDQLAKERACHIWGSYLYARFAYADSSYEHVQSSPCVFNPKGKPNRHTKLYDGVPLFTWVGDPDAVYWTYADVLRYLMTVYIVNAPITTPIHDGNGVDITDDIVWDSTDESWTIETLDTANPTLGNVLQTKCDELVAEGRSVVDALLLWCELSGCAMQQHTATESNEPATYIYFSYMHDGGPWTDAPASGERTPRDTYEVAPLAARPIRLGKSGSGVSGKSAQQATLDNEVFQGTVTWDTNNTHNFCLLLGAPERYEVRTHNFAPAWEADSSFGDNLDTGSGAMTAKLEQIAQIRQASGPDALEAAEKTLWHKYDAKGSTHLTYELVGRAWTMNESGEYETTTYGRTGTAQSEWAAYYPFDFHAECGVLRAKDPTTNERTIPWIERRRRILQPIVKGPHGEHLNVFIEASWDSGATWYPYGHNVRIDPDMCTLYLTDANLAKITKPEDDDSDVWSAIVQGTFRLRATFTVEGDPVVYGASHAVSGHSTLDRSKILHVFDNMKYENVTLGGSALRVLPTSTNTTDFDEYDRAASIADRFLSQSCTRRISASLELPWLTKKYLPGDLISGIEPRGVRFDTTRDAGTDARYPQIISVTWVSTNGGQGTRIILDDRRNDVSP